MKIVRYFLGLPKRFVRHMKREKFYKKYVNIDRGSYLGRDGIGLGCVVEGNENITIGKDSFIGEGSELLAYKFHFDKPLDSHLTIGNHVRITARCRITCAGNICIGNDSLLGPDVFITDHNHGMNPELKGGYSPQDITVKDVMIGEGVWLGQRVCVLPGVTVGNHSIIGANSVVTKNIPPYSMAVGAPARIVKQWNFDKRKWENV